VWQKHLLVADELLLTPHGDDVSGTLKRMEGAMRALNFTSEVKRSCA
jgi:hypothetical protein